MAADLDLRAARAHPVGVIDDRRREPEHAGLDRLERDEIDRGGLGRGAGLRARAVGRLTNHDRIIALRAAAASS